MTVECAATAQADGGFRCRPCGTAWDRDDDPPPCPKDPDAQLGPCGKDCAKCPINTECKP